MSATGWPLEYSELKEFYETASKKYFFPDLDIYYNDSFKNVKDLNDVQLNWSKVQEKMFAAKNPPFNFGEGLVNVFKNNLADLYYNATVVELKSSGGLKKIDRIEIISTNSKNKFILKSKLFILAANGIENSRLLLVSKDMCSQGLGNEFDQVGRYVMNHPKGNSGLIELNKPIVSLPFYFGCMYKNFSAYAGIRLLDSVQLQNKLLNSYVRFEPLFAWSNNKGVEAFIYLIKRTKIILKLFTKLMRGKVVALKDYAETGDDSELQNGKNGFLKWLGIYWSMIANFPFVLKYIFARLFGGKDSVSQIRLRNFMEMEPVSENRITLSDKKDEFGYPVAKITMNFSVLDKHTMFEFHKIFAEEIKNNGIGKFYSNLENIWDINQDASHYLGSTRMGNDQNSSVVNKDLRLHTVDNVYVIGGSVFSTSGCANPTFTICALSIRLARLLKEKYGN